MSRAIIIGLILAICSAVVIAQETPQTQDQSQKQKNQDFTLSVNATVLRTFFVYKKRFSAGTVSLNAYGDTSYSMYLVMVGTD